MVQNLNNNLITAPELSDMRKRLRNLESKVRYLLFYCFLLFFQVDNLTRSFSLHSSGLGVITLSPRSPCVFSPNATSRPTTFYRSCKGPAFIVLIALTYTATLSAELEMTVNMLIQIDKLVQLLESPVFTCKSVPSISRPHIPNPAPFRPPPPTPRTRKIPLPLQMPLRRPHAPPPELRLRRTEKPPKQRQQHRLSPHRIPQVCIRNTRRHHPANPGAIAKLHSQHRPNRTINLRPRRRRHPPETRRPAHHQMDRTPGQVQVRPGARATLTGRTTTRPRPDRFAPEPFPLRCALSRDDGPGQRSLGTA